MSLSGVDRSYWAIKNIYMPLPSSYAIGRQCWKAYLVFGSRCKYAAKIIHSFLSDSHSCLWKNCTKGSEKKEMFVRASAKAGGCVCGGWVGWGLTQTVRKRDIARQTQSQIQHNWTLFSVSGLSGLQVSPCNNKWLLLCNSQSATQAGWLAGWLEELPAVSVPASPVQTCHAVLPDIFRLCQFPHHHGSESGFWAHFLKKSVTRSETLLHRAEKPGLVSNQSVHLIPQAFGTH